MLVKDWLGVISNALNIKESVIFIPLNKIKIY